VILVQLVAICEIKFIFKQVIFYFGTIVTHNHSKSEIPEPLLRVLSEESAVRILRSATSPKNAYQLSQDCDISLTTVYRQIKRLNDKKLLVVSGSIDESGKKHFVFKSKQSVYCKCACSHIDLVPFVEAETAK